MFSAPAENDTARPRATKNLHVARRSMSTLLFEVASKLELADMVAMHLVGPVGKAQRARLRPGIREPEVVAHPCGAVGLDRPVDNLEGHVRRSHLDHGDLLGRGLVADRVHSISGVEDEEARLVDEDPRVGDALQGHGLLRDALPERDARERALAHLLQRALGHSDEPHAVVDAPRTETALSNLEAAAFAEEDVRGGYAHVLEIDLGVAVRRVVVAEDREVP